MEVVKDAAKTTRDDGDSGDDNDKLDENHADIIQKLKLKNITYNNLQRLPAASINNHLLDFLTNSSVFRALNTPIANY